MTSRRRSVWGFCSALAGCALMLMIANATLAALVLPPSVPEATPSERESLIQAMVRPPLAAVLGAALAIRTRRAGTPP
jgi:hypothetical protein